MASVRLTQVLRQAILNAMMIHAFGVREKHLERDKRALSLDVYNDVYPAEVQRIVKKLPKGFAYCSTSLQVAFDGDMTHVQFGESLPVAHEHRYCAARNYPPSHALTRRFKELEASQGALEKERKEARASAKAVLESVSTFTRLFEIWPESKPIASKFLPGPEVVAPGLPAVLMADLNTRLGLKKAS